jgi:hypothetical protein
MTMQVIASRPNLSDRAELTWGVFLIIRLRGVILHKGLFGPGKDKSYASQETEGVFRQRKNKVR